MITQPGDRYPDGILVLVRERRSEEAALLRKRAQKAAWDKKNAALRAASKTERRKSLKWPTWAYSCINSKKASGLDVSLKCADVMEILEKQSFKCALTGLAFWQSPKTVGSASWDSPSMDRIVHGGPYSPENVRIVLHCVNTFRGKLEDKQLVLIARALVRTLLSEPQALRRLKRAPNTKNVLYPNARAASNR